MPVKQDWKCPLILRGIHSWQIIDLRNGAEAKREQLMHYP